jgi:hypothetical protein
VAVPSTNTDPTAAGWVINDPVIRFRVLGSERAFDLAASDRWMLGSAPDCSLSLEDPSGRVSRRHAVAAREGDVWTMHDLGSTNGLRLNREERRSFQLAPGDEIELGGITLVAESPRSMALHDLLRRWLGWSTARLGEADRALREVRGARSGWKSCTSPRNSPMRKFSFASSGGRERCAAAGAASAARISETARTRGMSK